MSTELPLFPLNTVLFPGTPIHLHIFEERYKRMIRMCLDEQRPFGVVLIRRGAEALGLLAEPHTVGCTAKIINSQQLEQGRMNIVALGQDRFRILSLDSRSFPYLNGIVELFPIEAGDPVEITRCGDRLRGQVRRLIQTQLKAAGQMLDITNLPEDPVELAYLAASVLQISVDQKQQLLQIVQAEDLIDRVRFYYRREQALTESILSHGERESGLPFSIN
jgi:Lon protease-like protein